MSMRLAEILTNQNAGKGPQVILNGFSLREKKKNPGNIAIVRRNFCTFCLNSKLRTKDGSYIY